MCTRPDIPGCRAMRVASEASSNVCTERRSFPTPTPTDLARIRSRSTPSGSKPVSCGGRPLSHIRRFRSTCGKATWSPLRLETCRGGEDWPRKVAKNQDGDDDLRSRARALCGATDQGAGVAPDREGAAL